MELRKDYILERYVVTGGSRSKRPHMFKAGPKVSVKGVDVFARGNEAMTPPETGHIGEPWHIRWIPNKFPFVEEKKESEVHKKFMDKGSAWGYHEVIIETPGEKQLWELSQKEIQELFKVYADRVKSLEKNHKMKYVQLFKNHGPAGGTSLVHSHTQITSLAFVPTEVKDEVEASKKFGKKCYQQIIALEKKSPRFCFENTHAIAFCPFASRFNYEIWVFPKRYVENMSHLLESERNDIASLVTKALYRLRTIDASYNMFLHQAPKGESLHLHFKITPRIQTWAGFEMSTGLVINEVTPEDAAKFYRSKK
jgi:UDPglucose--hexose-1-phosphate uridylyltransferase